MSDKLKDQTRSLSDTEIDFFAIKKALPNLCSADLELVISTAASLLRKEAYREAIKTIQMASDPKVIELLKEYDK